MLAPGASAATTRAAASVPITLLFVRLIPAPFRSGAALVRLTRAASAAPVALSSLRRMNRAGALIRGDESASADGGPAGKPGAKPPAAVRDGSGLERATAGADALA